MARNKLQLREKRKACFETEWVFLRVAAKILYDVVK